MRFSVVLWHGESGTVAVVVDRKRDRAMGITSTMRDGSRFRELADIQCAALNRAAIKGEIAPSTWRN